MGPGCVPRTGTGPGSSRATPSAGRASRGSRPPRPAAVGTAALLGRGTRRPRARWGGDRGARPRSPRCSPSVSEPCVGATPRRLGRAADAQARPRRDADVAPWPKVPVGPVPRVLFICGSPNQTGQMVQVAEALPEVEAWFTSLLLGRLIHLAMVKGDILEQCDQRPQAPRHLRRRAERQRAAIDLGAERNEYDLWVCPNDAVVPPGSAETPWVLVQEGIMEQPNWRTWVWRYTRLMPRPLATTAVFGLSKALRRSSASPARDTGGSSSPTASRRRSWWSPASPTSTTSHGSGTTTSLTAATCWSAPATGARR